MALATLLSVDSNSQILLHLEHFSRLNIGLNLINHFHAILEQIEMLVKKLNDFKEIEGGDKTIIKEILHPKNEGINFPFSIAHSRVKLGGTSIKHTMKTTEVYYILRGSGIMHINDETKEVMQDSVIYIPPTSFQYIENTGNRDLEFLCIVAPPWQPKDEQNSSREF